MSVEVVAFIDGDVAVKIDVIIIIMSCYVGRRHIVGSEPEYTRMRLEMLYLKSPALSSPCD